MPAGLAAERAAAGRLALTPACRHLVGVFLLREKSRKLPPELQAYAPSKVTRVGIIGAGVMGAGIAQLAALRGCEVYLQEVNEEALGRGIFRINELFQKAAARGIVGEQEYARAMNAIHPTLDWKGFDTVEVVVEAAVEDLEVKKALFRQLAEKTKPETILATNTSALSVTSLQEGLPNPERVAGLHFFNPVHKMPLIEVVRTPASSERTAGVLMQWALALGKTPVLVRDSPGFVVNRILMPYLNEAVLLVAEGMAIQQVDEVMRRFGMPMGPLELLDQVGLDIAAHVARSMQPHFGDRFSLNPAFEQMTESTWLGQKSGAGFYRYRGKKSRVNKDVLPLLRSAKPADARMPITSLPRGAQPREAQERMVLLMVNEAAACVGEQLTAGPEQVDLAMIFGTGWAPHRGGPLRYADERGLSNLVQALEEMAARLGRRFEPCPELRRRGQAGEQFYR
jgi:3-hydroxyacyl-CoA dehydrogenase/enoyl-CoA hydratase/3-hydroxybutyryl-CoA epimerase